MQKNKFIQQRFSNGDTNRGLKTSNKQNDRKQLESFRSNIKKYISNIFIAL